MRKIKELIFASVCLLGMTVAVSSCVEPGPDGPDKPAITGSTIMLPNEANAVVEVTLDMKSDWNVSNANTWFTVQPLSGVAGQATFTITVLKANPELTEKVASFRINEGDTPTEYYVVQDVTPGMVLASESVAVPSSESEISFVFNSNVDVEVVSAVDWITVGEIAKDSVLLSDNTTYSKFKTYTVNVSVAANDGEIRDGIIEVRGAGDISSYFTVSQMGELVADFTRQFYRRSYLAKFSATWCGPCYSASEYIHEAMEEVPNRIEIGTYMSKSQGGGLAEWEGGDTYYEELYYDGIIQGFIPTMIWNNYSLIEGAAYASTFVSLSNEAVEELPAHTGVAGSVSINGNNVEVLVGIASTESAEYKVSVFLLEDKLTFPGCAGGSDYENNDIIREEMTEMWGEPVSLSANNVTELKYTCAIPSYVENNDNLHVLVVVYRPGSYSSPIIGGHDFGTIVDNVVDIPVNSFIVFEYEK